MAFSKSWHKEWDWESHRVEERVTRVWGLQGSWDVAAWCQWDRTPKQALKYYAKILPEPLDNFYTVLTHGEILKDLAKKP